MEPRVVGMGWPVTGCWLPWRWGNPEGRKSQPPADLLPILHAGWPQGKVRLPVFPSPLGLCTPMTGSALGKPEFWGAHGGEWGCRGIGGCSCIWPQKVSFSSPCLGAQGSGTREAGRGSPFTLASPGLLCWVRACRPLSHLEAKPLPSCPFSEPSPTQLHVGHSPVLPWSHPELSTGGDGPMWGPVLYPAAVLGIVAEELVPSVHRRNLTLVGRQSWVSVCHQGLHPVPLPTTVLGQVLGCPLNVSAQPPKETSAYPPRLAPEYSLAHAFLQAQMAAWPGLSAPLGDTNEHTA